MSKKLRILTVLALVVTLGLTSIIGYHGSRILGLYYGHQAGYTAGYIAGIQSPIKPTLNQSPLYTSFKNSIARRQSDQNRAILPLGTAAFEPDHYDFELMELQSWTGYEDFRDFYESFSIVITDESELAGWFECQLPEGWSISYDDTPDPSRDESVSYIMPDGTEAFHIISLKNASTHATSLAPNLDLFPFPS